MVFYKNSEAENILDLEFWLKVLDVYKNNWLLQIFGAGYRTLIQNFHVRENFGHLVDVHPRILYRNGSWNLYENTC